MNVPCKDCKDRTPGCHSKCEKYIAYDKENQKARDKRAICSMVYGESPEQKRRKRNYHRYKSGGYK